MEKKVRWDDEEKKRRKKEIGKEMKRRKKEESERNGLVLRVHIHDYIWERDNERETQSFFFFFFWVLSIQKSLRYSMHGVCLGDKQSCLAFAFWLSWSPSFKNTKARLCSTSPHCGIAMQRMGPKREWRRAHHIEDYLTWNSTTAPLCSRPVALLSWPCVVWHVLGQELRMDYSCLDVPAEGDLE